MSLADALPALEQKTIDGALGGQGVFSTLGYMKWRGIMKHPHSSKQAMVRNIAN
jgi:hypothetical protein